MLSPFLVITASFAYLLLLFAVAYWADRRAQQGRSVIANPWVYALSLAVYCTAWTYFGSVGRAASGGVWFLPIYLGPTLVMVLGWIVLRKMVRIAKTYRITSIADFIASRYGKSPLLAGLVTLIAVVGIVPYIALQLKAVSAGYTLLTATDGATAMLPLHWSQDSAFYVALVLAGFAMVFGARHLDTTERHEGMVAAIAFESVVKLVAFLSVGFFVVYSLFDGLEDLFARAQAIPELQQLLRLEQGGQFAWAQWFGLTVLSMFSVVFLPRQFQVMVVENVRETHLRRAVWVFPLYLLLINLFVLPIALAVCCTLARARPMRRTLCCRCPWPPDRMRWRCSPLWGGFLPPPAWSLWRPWPCPSWSAMNWCCPCCCAGGTCAAAKGKTCRACFWGYGGHPFWVCWCWAMFTFIWQVKPMRW